MIERIQKVLPYYFPEGNVDLLLDKKDGANYIILKYNDEVLINYCSTKSKDEVVEGFIIELIASKISNNIK